MIEIVLESSNLKIFEKWLQTNHRTLSGTHLYYISLHCKTLLQVDIVVNYVHKNKLGRLLFLCILNRNKIVLESASFKKRVKYSHSKFEVEFSSLLRLDLLNALILLNLGLDFCKICGSFAAKLLCNSKVRKYIRHSHSFIVEQVEILDENILDIIMLYL